LLLTALVFFCCSALPADTLGTPTTSRAIEVVSPVAAAPAEEAKPAKPDAPTPKVLAASNGEPESSPSAGAPAPSSEPLLISPVKPATTDSFETPRKKAIWYGLMAAGHGAAVFDAWTTRRAVSGGYGVESDPMQSPFAHSGAIYATTQVSPLVMDYLGHRMMRSRYPFMRRFWWVPQAACASVSLGSGIHNYRVVP